MGLVRRFDHLAIAVPSLADAATLFLDLFGGTFLAGGDDDGRGIRTLHVGLPPGVKLELMQPTRDDSYLAAYLARHGPGFHHATLFVDDLRETLDALTAAGVELVDTDWTARRGSRRSCDPGPVSGRSCSSSRPIWTGAGSPCPI